MKLEDMMNRIESISGMLEKGDISLEESIQLYEEAAGLIRQATKLLDEAEQKVMVLTSGKDGARIEPFDAGHDE